MANYTIGKAIEIPLKDFAPDLPPQTPGIVLDLDGVIPTLKGYAARPAPDQTAATALPGFNPPSVRPFGSFLARFGSIIRLFAATQTHIYRLDPGNVWVEVGGPYSAVTRWQFTQFLNDVIAVTFGEFPQVYNETTGVFQQLTDAPPNLTAVAAVAGTVFGVSGNAWFNSAFGVDNNWTPNIQTQAAQGILTDFPGAITAIAPLFRNIIIWQAESMLMGTFVGGQSTWSFQILSNKTGTGSPASLVLLPDAVAFVGSDDFYITSGFAPQRIPNNLKEWFFGKINQAFLDRIEGWYDPNDAIIYWHAVSLDSPIPGVPDFYVAYNVRAQRWGKGQLLTYGIVPNTVPNRPNGFFFDEHAILQTWVEAAQPGKIVTGFFGDSGRLTQAFRVQGKYNVNPTNEVLIPRSTDILGSPIGTGIPATLGVDGWHYFRQYNRYHQIQLTTVGEMEITGFSFEGRSAGTR